MVVSAVQMEARMLWIALLVFLITWKNADARKIVIFEHSEIPVRGRFSLHFPSVQTNCGNGPLLIRQEVFNLANGILIREEAQQVVFGGDMPESVPRLSRVNQKLAEGLSKMLNIVPRLSEVPLEKTVSRSGGLKFHGSSLGLFCNTCMEVSKQAEEVLSDPETLENAVKLAKSICNELPSDLSAKCDEMLGTYIQEVVSTLQDYLSQDKLCIGTGLCNGNNNNDLQYKLGMGRNTPSLDAGDDTTCVMCEQFIEEATYYASQNTTQSEVLAALHQTCSKLGVFGTKCKTMVDYYAPIIFLEIATISPKEFCQKISICSDSSSLALNREKNNCDVCESAILEIETHLKDPETKMKVIEMLLDGCKRVQGHEQECKKLVFEYGPLILTNLEKYLDSNDICSQIHVCEHATRDSEKNDDLNGQSFIKLPSLESSAHAHSK